MNRILLVEDNAVNRMVALRVLESAGHQVKVAGDGYEALDLLEREEFDVVLMDVQMPVMDGLEATREIRAREAESGRHRPIVAMTAAAMLEDRERCAAAGMDGYLKPVRRNELLAVAASFAGARSSAGAGINAET